MDDERRSDPTSRLLEDFVRRVSEQVAVPEFVTRHQGPRRRAQRVPTGLRALAAVITVAAVVAAVALVVAYGPRSARISPGRTPATQPPPGPTQPIPGSTSTTSAAVAACTLSQLTASAGFDSSGTGLGSITLRNTATGACSLSGQASVRVLDGAGQALALGETTYHQAPDWPPPSSPIVLSPSGALPQAVVALDWIWCGPSPGKIRLEVQFSGWRSSLAVPNEAISPPGFAPVTCASSGLQALFAVDYVRGLGPNGPIGPAPSPSLTTTEQITYEPFTATGIDPSLHVASQVTGTCIRYGGGAAGRFSYRCFASPGAGIYDPCFAGPASTSEPLVCPTSPTSNEVVELNVTSVTSDEPPSPSKIPWAMQLSGGQVCLLVSAAWGGLGPYACQGAGNQQSVADCHTPVASVPLWTAACQTQQTDASPFGTKDVTKVWY